MGTKKKKTTSEKKTRRSHTPEFKAEAANLVLEQGMSQADVARDLGVSPSLIGRWVHLAREQARPGAISTEERAELQRLRKENKVLRTEREILKNRTSRTRQPLAGKTRRRSIGSWGLRGVTVSFMEPLSPLKNLVQG